jgi:hypothetical protein
MASALLDEALAAHGGLERWRELDMISAHARSGGFALASKFAAGPFRSYELTVSTKRPRTVITPYPAPGRRGMFLGAAVQIESDAGEILERRADPRRLFPGGRRLIRWDRLDALYFAGYALWNYFNLPFLLAEPSVELREEGRTLRARFPDGAPTHSREQAFHLDERGLIVQHDYTAEVFGGWAKAANVSLEFGQFAGLTLASRRRVTPRARSGGPRRLPVLVSLEFSPRG